MCQLLTLVPVGRKRNGNPSMFVGPGTIPRFKNVSAIHMLKPYCKRTGYRYPSTCFTAGAHLLRVVLCVCVPWLLSDLSSGSFGVASRLSLGVTTGGNDGRCTSNHACKDTFATDMHTDLRASFLNAVLTSLFLHSCHGSKFQPWLSSLSPQALIAARLSLRPHRSSDSSTSTTAWMLATSSCEAVLPFRHRPALDCGL